MERAQILLKTGRYTDRDEQLQLWNLVTHNVFSGHKAPFAASNLIVLQNILGGEQTLVEAIHDERGIRFLILSEERGLVDKLGDAAEDLFGAANVFDGTDTVYSELLNYIMARSSGKTLP